MNREQTIESIKNRIEVEEGLIDWWMNQVKEELTEGKDRQPEDFFGWLKDVVRNYEQRADRVKTYRDFITWLENMED